MKRKFLVLVVVVLAAGFWRGWVVLTGPQRQPTTNKVDVNLTIDPEKMKEDANRVEGKAEELKDKVRDEFRRD